MVSICYFALHFRLNVMGFLGDIWFDVAGFNADM